MNDTLLDSVDPVHQFRELWKAGRPDVVAFVAARDLTLDDLTDVLRFDQQERWRAGDDVPAEWYLEHFPKLTADPDPVRVLIYGEVVARTERGERPALTDFVLRFPEHAEFLTLQWEVHTALENAAVGSTMTFDGPPGGPPAAAPVVPGYEIEAEVGRGAVGVVYRARQAAINRLCALKVVIGGQRAWGEKLRRFMEEGRVIARLKHPNIVGIYDLGTHETGPFMALEWVGGGTLADRVKAGPLAPVKAAELVATLARAAGYAHAKGIVHRDLKPANVLLQSDGTGSGTDRFPVADVTASGTHVAAPAPGSWVPKIADFGLAMYLNADPADAPPTGGPVGTPTYMAPEQTRGAADVTPTADVYSLGVILYELLTGRVPLAGATVPDTLRLVADRDPQSPRELNAAVPRDLQTVCLKCLEKDPKKRYPTGHALADDLNRFLAGEPIAARPVGPLGRGLRRLGRHPRAATAAVLGAVLAITTAAGVVAGVVWLDAERRRAELAERGAVDRLNEELRAQAATRAAAWRALVSDARAVRRSGRPGQRTAALARLREARQALAELTPDDTPPADDLGVIRDEVVACLALPDVEPADDVGPMLLPPAVFFRGEPTGGAVPAMAGRSPDGRLGVTAHPPDGLRVWDLPAGRVVFATPGRLDGGAAFGADGRTLTYRAGGRVARLRVVLPVGHTVLAGRPGVRDDRLGPVPSPDGKVAAARAGYGVIRLSDAATGRPLVRLEVPEPTRLNPAWLDAGDAVPRLLVLAVGVEDGATHVWDLGVIRAELRELGLDW